MTPVELDEPAMPLTTQTTVPMVTTLLFTLSLAMIGFIGTVEKWPYTTVWVIGKSSKDVSLWLLSLSAFLFLFTALGCVKAHAWDYFSISTERRTEEGLSSTASYVNKCWNYSWLWYKLAIWSYSLGAISLLLGVSLLFWPVSRFTSILSLIFLLLPLITKIIDSLFSKNMAWQARRQDMIKRILKENYRA